MTQKVYKGDTGTLIELDTSVDITDATSQLIKYIKPDGTIGQWTAVIDDTKLTYTTISGDLNQSGYWMFQGYIASPDWTGHTDEVQIEVHEPITVS